MGILHWDVFLCSILPEIRKTSLPLEETLQFSLWCVLNVSKHLLQTYDIMPETTCDVMGLFLVLVH